MKTQCFAVYALVLFILTIGGCSDSESPQPVTSDTGEFLPLHTENTWLRRHTVLDTTGNIIFSDTVRTTLVRVDTIGGEVRYQTNAGLYYISRSTGLWMVNDAASAPFQLYRLPVVEGEAYQLRDTAGKTTIYTVLDLDAGVKVEAGEFQCWKIAVACPPCGVMDTTYIAPGVGDVLTVARYTDGRRAVIEMVSYQVK